MPAPCSGERTIGEALDAALPAWRQAGHRLPILISGSSDWTLACARALVDDDTLWIGPDTSLSVRSLSFRRAREALGQEARQVVFNALSGFDPDALGAVAGLPRAGGCLILLAPPLDDWPTQVDPELARITPYPFSPADAGSAYIQRLVRLLRESSLLWRLAEGHPLPPVPAAVAGPVYTPDAGHAPCRTADQTDAVERILSVAQGRPRRPLVLRSHRGRGKSSALGIAAARVLQVELGDVLVTAPRREAVAPLFDRAAKTTGIEPHADGSLQLGEHRLRFLPPDVLLKQRPSARLLLIDEAAALPASVLESLFATYPRTVFATTEHGYEGSGRGFTLRFLPYLQSQAVSVHHHWLTTAIRWSADDPLESLINCLLLLDADPAELPGDTIIKTGPPTRLDPEALATDEAGLSELFGLLVSAHYRTTPRDLRQLLDAPGVQLWSIKTPAGQVVATAATQDEGGLPAPLAEAIFRGQRRPRGHLLPQTMATHAGERHWATLRGRRIQRIAVHPDAQRQGLGRQLVAALAEQAQTDQFDFLGVSFGAEDELIDFWRACGLESLHLGQLRDPASGQEALVMATGLSPVGRQAVEQSARRFIHSLPTQAAGPLRHIDPARLAHLLARARPMPLPLLDSEAWRQIEACARHQHHFDAALAPLRVFLPAALTQPAVVEAVSAQERALLIGRFLQLTTDDTIARWFGLAGRRDIDARCRQTLRHVLEALDIPDKS
ncbi:MAG: GNAT family N-acetyltransferase [Halothiobacillaceae bacterium]